MNINDQLQMKEDVMVKKKRKLKLNRTWVKHTFQSHQVPAFRLMIPFPTPTYPTGGCDFAHNGYKHSRSAPEGAS